MRRVVAYLILLFTLAQARAQADAPSPMTRARACAEDVARTLHAYLEGLRALDRRAVGGRISAEEFDRAVTELDRGLAACAERCDVDKLFALATPLGTEARSGDAAGAGKILPALAVASLGLIAAEGFAYHQLTTPYFDGDLGTYVHLGAAAVAGWVGATVTAVAGALPIMVFVKGVDRVRARTSALADAPSREDLERAYHARLADHGIVLARAAPPVPRAHELGGISDDRNDLARAAAELLPRIADEHDRGRLAAIAERTSGGPASGLRRELMTMIIRHGLAREISITDVALLGSAPVFVNYCNGLLSGEEPARKGRPIDFEMR